MDYFIYYGDHSFYASPLWFKIKIEMIGFQIISKTVPPYQRILPNTSLLLF